MIETTTHHPSHRTQTHTHTPIPNAENGEYLDKISLNWIFRDLSCWWKHRVGNVKLNLSLPGLPKSSDDPPTPNNRPRIRD
jgi:hypothetical protein